MDETLKDFLDKQDWVKQIESLTLAAMRQMKLCGWNDNADNAKTNPMATKGLEYAMEAMAKAYEGCCTTENRYDPTRGKFYPWIERLVRRLVTDDAEKRKIRSKWPLVPLEHGEEVEAKVEEASELTLIEMVSEADDALAAFISAAVTQLEENPGSLRVHWGQLQTTLGISRHRCDQLRPLLERHLERCLKQSV